MPSKDQRNTGSCLRSGGDRQSTWAAAPRRGAARRAGASPLHSTPLRNNALVHLESDATCEVVVLAPHASSRAVLVRDGGIELAVSLPCLTLGPEPEAPEITRRIAERLGTAVTILRASALAWHQNFDAAAMVVEIAPVTPVATALDDTLGWRALEVTEAASVAPEWAHESVASWLRERQDGWADLRPQWSRPGWLSDVGPWMQQQMRLAGYRDPQPPQIHHLWGVSVVLSADSDSGRAYLKCSGDHFRSEAVVTQALATQSPSLLPEVIATDSDRGWLLMRDLGGQSLGDQSPARWGLGLVALHQLQQQWLGRTDELLALGAASRSLDDLATWVGGTTENDAVMRRFTAQEQAAWTSAVPSLVESCRQMAVVGPGPSLTHGDFHPWNVVVTPEGVRVFDWTDASVAHPFIDLVTYVMRSPDPATRPLQLDQYLRLWDADLRDAELRDMSRLALVVGALHQAQTYDRLIPTVMPADLGQLRDGDIEWLKRALRVANKGTLAQY